MSTKELLNTLEQGDLQKLYQAKKFSEQASRNQYSLFSFKRIKALYLELAEKYKVEIEQIISLVRSLDDSNYIPTR